MGRTKGNTRSQAIVLGMANMIVSLAMFAAPMILVRLLDRSDFAEYRLFWLLANTAHLIAPLGLPRSLMYFLPRVDRQEKASYVTQVIMMLCITGLLAAFLVSPLNPLFPERLQLEGGYIVPAFVFLWVLSCLVETLPTADQNFTCQAFALISNSVSRLALVTGAAYFTGDIQYVFLSLLLFVLFKLAILAFYLRKHHPVRFSSLSWARIKAQISYALPFGLANIIDNLRRQVEQWIVALIFLPEMFAVFSLGALEIPVLRLLRRTLGQVVFPKMSQAHVQGDFKRVLYLNQSANLAVAFVVFPLAAFIFVQAKPLVTLLFTREYVGAAVVFQIYLVLTIARVIDVSNIMMIFSQKLFMTKVSLVLLLGSSLLSYLGARTLGIAGAACGSVIAQILITIITYQRATRLLRVRFIELQDWQSLGHAMFGSVIAAAATSFFLHMLGPDLDLLFRITAGAFLFSTAYAGYLWFSGYGWVFKTFANKADWSKEFMKKRHPGNGTP
ncbi:MAG: oligosaccharide flippase family protein [Desulfobacterales bacterium]|nr:oligosaccharide flippase family protein [Desulfobacterales bacterium]